MPEIVTSPVLLILVGIFGYLLGSVPFGIVITRALGLGDLRAIGSGNIGATNVLRTGHKGAALATLGIHAAAASPIGAGRADGAPEIAELIRSGSIAAVVNTPSPESGVLRDALEIRLAAVEEGVLCLTTMETAVAAATSLAVRSALASVAIAPLGNGGLRERLR